MKTIITYQCEICGMRHQLAEDALQCEGQGVAAEIPIGTIFGSAKGFYEDMVFVIAKNWIDGHSNRPALWAFRDNGAGDSLGRQDVCGSNNSTTLDKNDAANRKHPTFARAVAFLKKHKIEPLVWNGKEIEPL